jgi:hypothetical protein
MSRSGSPYSTPRDANHVPLLVAASTTDGVTPVVLEADPTTHALVTSGSGGGSSGTQYTDGAAAVTHPIGTQPVFTNGSNVVTAVSTSNPLPVSASVAPVSDTPLTTGTISAQDVASSTTTGVNNQSITTGTPTTNSAYAVTVSSRETIFVGVSGTWTGNLMSEGSYDGGATWVSKAIKQTGTAYTTNNFTGNFQGEVNAANLTNYRIRSTATWTGSATVNTNQSSNPHSFYIANNLALRDGTNQSVTNTIKVASTPAVATDTSVVVGLSPNSPLPVGSNAIGSVSVSNFPATQPVSVASTLAVNMTQLNGVAGSVNNGTTDAGTQRVTLSSDSTGQVKLAAGTSTIGNVGSSSATSAAVPANAFYLGASNGTNLIGLTTVTAASDASNIPGGLIVGPWIYNGTNWDRLRSATSATGTTGTGLAGAGILGFDGTNYRRVASDTSGNLIIRQRANTSASTNVAASATTVTVLALNTSRIAAQIYNDSTALLYLKLGATASTTSFTVILAAGGYYEVPGGYTGVIDGIWASATGTARVTEET